MSGYNGYIKLRKKSGIEVTPFVGKVIMSGEDLRQFEKAITEKVIANLAKMNRVKKTIKLKRKIR